MLGGINTTLVRGISKCPCDLNSGQTKWRALGIGEFGLQKKAAYRVVASIFAECGCCIFFARRLCGK